MSLPSTERKRYWSTVAEQWRKRNSCIAWGLDQTMPEAGNLPNCSLIWNSQLSCLSQFGLKFSLLATETEKDSQFWLHLCPLTSRLISPARKVQTNNLVLQFMEVALTLLVSLAELSKNIPGPLSSPRSTWIWTSGVGVQALAVQQCPLPDWKGKPG